MDANDSEFVLLLGQTLDFLIAGLAKVHSSVRGAISSVSLHAGLRSNEVKDLYSIVKGLSSTTTQLQGSIGSRPASVTGPSLWGTAATSTSRLNAHENAFSSFLQKIASLSTEIEELRKVVQQSNVDGAQVNESQDDVDMEDMFGPDGPRISAAGYMRPPRPTAAPTSGASAGMGGASGGGGGGHPGGGYSSTAPGGSGDPSGNPNPNAFAFNTAVPQGPAISSSTFENLVNRVDNHESRILSLESRRNGDGTESVFWDNHTFHRPDDVQALFEKEVGVNARIYFGCFVNPIVLLDACFHRLSSSVKVPKDLKDVLALDLRSIEVESFLSLQPETVVPMIFAATDRLKGFAYLTKSSATAGARFPAVPSAKDFGHQQDDKGLYSALLSHLRQIRREKMTDISRNYGKYPVLHNLATQLLAHSITFVEELLAFMSQTYLTLTESFSGDEKAWDCVCKSVEDLFISQFAPAKSEMASADLSDPKLLAKLVIWTSLRVTSVAVELSHIKISSHPDVTSSYVRFLIDHVGDKQSHALKSALGQVNSLKEEVSSLKKELTSLKGHIASVESRVEKMKKK